MVFVQQPVNQVYMEEVMDNATHVHQDAQLVVQDALYVRVVLTHIILTEPVVFKAAHHKSIRMVLIVPLVQQDAFNVKILQNASVVFLA
jgi:hypothetical protein